MHNLPGISMVIASDDDYEHLVTEISYKGQMLCLISQDKGVECLEIIFPSATGVDYSINLDLFLRAIEYARKDILNHRTLT